MKALTTIGSAALSRRQLLERYKHLREDHLRYMQQWGLIRPSHRAHGETFYAFQDLTTIRHVHSTERLIDQSLLLMHRDTVSIGRARRDVLRDLHQSNRILAGKKVLIVDDDMRNIFALATVLEEQEMIIASVDNGRAAIQTLREQLDIDVVLMDIMMPELDGIDTMRAIRKLPRFARLPIIAVTAKAMKGDREKCIEAGAWDYLSKPVDPDQLLSTLCAWLVD